MRDSKILSADIAGGASSPDREYTRLILIDFFQQLAFGMIEIERRNYFSRQIEYNQNVIFLKPSAPRAPAPARILYPPAGSLPREATLGIVSPTRGSRIGISHIEETTIEKDGFALYRFVRAASTCFLLLQRV